MEKYDKASIESIFHFAQMLTGKSLDEVVTLPASIANSRNKGDLGGLLEAHFFELPPNNQGIDFPEAKLELKTTGVIQNSEGSHKAKERLVLTMINYMNIVDEEWESSVFYLKCRLMLIMFYLYEKGIPSIHLKFVIDPMLFRIADHDEDILKKDWEFIREKVKQGRAHEISEGDTYYLGACRKGPGGVDEPLRPQPFSGIGAKSRAFSFKPSYVNSLIMSHQSDVPRVLLSESDSFEKATAARFQPFVGLSIDEISEKLTYFKNSPQQKGFVRELSVRILANGENSVPELTKAGVEMKIVRLNKFGKPKEAMSFPGFRYLEIVDEAWEDSSFFKKLESRFLFIVFRADSFGVERLQGATYWNMPYGDRLEAQRVWEETKRRVLIDASDLPKASESTVAHVRPKAKNSSDTIPTPQGTMLVKKCFWLNASYIGQVLEPLVKG
jgi:DNA mismatch repair protein MutH